VGIGVGIDVGAEVGSSVGEVPQVLHVRAHVCRTASAYQTVWSMHKYSNTEHVQVAPPPQSQVLGKLPSWHPPDNVGGSVGGGVGGVGGTGVGLGVGSMATHCPDWQCPEPLEQRVPSGKWFAGEPLTVHPLILSHWPLFSHITLQSLSA